MLDPVSASLIVGFSTILASGVTSSVVTYRLNRNKDQMIFMRGKAEQLFLAADEYEKMLGGQLVTFFPLLEGRIDYNQMLDLQIDHGSKPRERGGAETLEMLVEIYFPTTRAALRQLWLARDAFNSVAQEIKRTYQAEGHATHADLKAKLLAASGAVSEATKALKAAIVEAARRYAGVNQIVAPTRR